MEQRSLPGQGEKLRFCERRDRETAMEGLDPRSVPELPQSGPLWQL